MSRRRGSLTGSPVLVGAVTLIVTMVAVFLSFNANEGLPFVPTYDLTANVPNANGLVRGNEVRMGGSRIGVVTDIEADPKEDGSVAANLALELDERVMPLPRDSTLIVRPRSALGLKYVEVTRGDSEDGYSEGDTIPLAASQTETQEIDDFFNMFDAPTRVGSRTNLETFGAAFAGRGTSLNATFAELGPLVEKLEPVMRNVNAPRTAFARLFPALEQAASEAAPVAGEQAALFAALDTTFTAWASVSDSLQETISEGPPALETATRELPRQRPFLADSEELFRRFRPAFASLGAAAPGLARAFRVGEPALRRSPALNRRLTRTLAIVDEFGDDPRVPSGLARLTSTAELARPTLAYLEPAQTRCNYGALFFRNLARITSMSDVVGSMLLVSPIALPLQVGSLAGPSAVPANGPEPPSDPDDLPDSLSTLKDYPLGRFDSLLGNSYLHSNPYPNTAAPGQPLECEAGNEGYPGAKSVVIGNPDNPTGIVTEQTRRVLPKRGRR
ncbi:MAG: MlaD family protein [Thermoleophilaceae bacterium]